LSFPFLQSYLGLGSGLQTKNAAGGGGGGVGGWVELGRTTLGSAGATINVSSLPNKRYYMLLNSTHSTAHDAEPQGFRFNGDSGSNYCNRHSADGSSDTTQPSKNYFLGFGLGSSGKSTFTVNCVSNFSTKEKLIQTLGWVDNNHGLGAGTAPRRAEVVGKWANTSNAISSIALVNGINFATDSELVVLGYDPADTHSNNFWTELASVSATSGTSLSTGVFTAKKYLWVQAYIKSTSTASRWRVGNTTIDTGNNYSERGSFDGASDFTDTSRDRFAWTIDLGLPEFLNFFIVNVSSKEKLFTGNLVAQNTAGASTAPRRLEFAGKWANTSNQINNIQYVNLGSGSITSAEIKVWGSD